MTVIRRAVLALGLLVAGHVISVRAEDPAHFVGSAACSGCHQTEEALWKASHHAQAMQPATQANMLGDFNNASYSLGGITSRFYRTGDTYMVQTEGPDGTLRDYEIAYTFGVYPLQQYLAAFPGGRLQALGVAWDSRAKDKGGQRWFHLYPDHKLSPGDPMHWTGRDQTWNYMCASCHSTNLQKNYDLGSNSYKTTWTDVDVSCEACHGPGSAHLNWARTGKPPLSDADQMGLTVSLKPADQGHWEMNPETGIAKRTEKLVSKELDTCASCHARRKEIAKAPEPGASFLNSYLPALIEPGLYHPDGQIDGEVYEYGSFVQSRMYRAGVTCSNCHEPHSTALRAEGNSLCAQCHMPAKFDGPEHHHHQAGSAGAQCVNCHMATKTYMIVDDRRDHSLRVPRPDLSVSIGTPNACNQCHRDRSSHWAASTVAQWYPNGRQTSPHYGTALQAGRVGATGAERQLDTLILDAGQPAIARATALTALPRYASAASAAAIASAVADPDALVRAAAPRALSAAASPATVQAALSLLRDPVRAVRVEAARALSGVPAQVMSPELRSAFAAAYAELVAAESTDEDRPEAHLNLGLLDTRRAQPADAEAEYRTALRLDPNFVPALANLADLDRMGGMDAQGAELLRKALAIEPANADVMHALGLSLVRQHNYAEALPLLRRAAELAPDNVRYGYVYAIALSSTGSPEQGRALLERIHRQHPADRDVLVALIAGARSAGDLPTALSYARELAELDPGAPQVQMLLLDLEKQRSH
ncbi:MAG: tetratricopeptide repeat protein [Rhodopila sp.]|nr:tetratricopeptide repeat protein [Rhodopila sp.]